MCAYGEPIRPCVSKTVLRAEIFEQVSGCGSIAAPTQSLQTATSRAR